MIPKELDIAGVYVPPSLIVGLMALAAAWATAWLLNRVRFTATSPSRSWCSWPSWASTSRLSARSSSGSDAMKTVIRYVLAAAIVLAAVAALGARYIDYLRNPWTRDGQSGPT